MINRNFLLVSSCLLVSFMSNDVMSIQCKQVETNCENIGYRDSASSCPETGNRILCPFNTNAAVCDREADRGDYKFSIALSANQQWEPASDYYDHFIVGAGTDKCGTTVGSTVGPRIPPHTHSVMKNATCSYSITGAAEGTVLIFDKSNINTPTSGSGKGVHPIHYTVLFEKYKNLMSKNSDTTSNVGDIQPTCENLGYKDTKDQCPGEFVPCPLINKNIDNINNNDPVMCDMQAVAGEIKFSLQTEDHSGWILANGRNINDDDSIYANSELAKMIPLEGSERNIPNYSGAFLRASSSASFAITEDAFPSHRHENIEYPKISLSYATVCTTGKTCKNSSYLIKPTLTTNVIKTTGSTTIVRSDGTQIISGDEVAPPHYIANVFIYSGKLNQPANSLEPPSSGADQNVLSGPVIP